MMSTLFSNSISTSMKRRRQPRFQAVETHMFDPSIKAVLCDIGGVLYVGDTSIPGAIEALVRIKSRYSVRFVTNTTQKTAQQVVEALRLMGFDIAEDEVLTALDVTKLFLKNHDSRGFYLLTDDATAFFDDLNEIERQHYVVVGDAQENFTYERLNKAFRLLQSGSELIAVAKNRYFKDNDYQLSMDAGGFVSALEYASGKKAHIIGKPSHDFYRLACSSMNVEPAECLMIGDDIESDILGAQEAGLKTLLVKTGKFVVQDLESGIMPDFIADSIADIP